MTLNVLISITGHVIIAGIFTSFLHYQSICPSGSCSLPGGVTHVSIPEGYGHQQYYMDRAVVVFQSPQRQSQAILKNTLKDLLYLLYSFFPPLWSSSPGSLGSQGQSPRPGTVFFACSFRRMRILKWLGSRLNFQVSAVIVVAPVGSILPLELRLPGQQGIKLWGQEARILLLGHWGQQ